MDYLIQPLEELKKLKPITSEEEYWSAHKLVISSIDQLRNNILKFKTSANYLDTLNSIFYEAVRTKVLNQSQALKLKNKVLSGISFPSRTKSAIKTKIQKAISSLKKAKKEDKKLYGKE